MKHSVLAKLLSALFILMLAACAPAATAAPVSTAEPARPSPSQTTAPTTLPSATMPAEPAQATVPAEPTQAALSFSPATYKDETNGFELDYPSDWTVVPNTVIGTRGSQAQLLSPGTTAEKLADGGTRVSITLYLWDPKGDLTAYALHRKSAWEGSGASILRETSELAGGRKQISFTVRGPDGQPAFFMLTNLGGNYLEISGDGNVALVEAIAQTMRPIN